MAEDKLIFWMIARKVFAGFILPHTSFRGCRCAFWGLRPLTVTYFLTFDLKPLLPLINGGGYR